MRSMILLPKRVKNAKRHIRGSHVYNLKKEAARRRTKEQAKNEAETDRSTVVTETDRSTVVTDEVSWLIPSSSMDTENNSSSSFFSCSEWKAVLDDVSGCHYFYHTRTRETTWEKPESFNEWRAVENDVSGEISYYNVLTRTTSLTNPHKYSNKTNGIEDEGNGIEIASPEQVSASLPVLTCSHESEGEGEDYNHHTRSGDDALKLITQYYPEVCSNVLLLRKLKRLNKTGLRTMQTLIFSTCCPFDEVRESIESLLKKIPTENKEDVEVDTGVGVNEGNRNDSSSAVPQNHDEGIELILNPSYAGVRMASEENNLKQKQPPIVYFAGRNDVTIQYV